MAKGESKSYDPASVEKRVFELWMQGGYFHPQPDDRPREQRFCMVIPPPNVTGALHLGHALNNTLQDILIRQKRMAGCNTFWLLGTDHAGIATQATVEKTIRKEEGKSRQDLGREELVRRIWEWKEKHGGRIIEQLKLMGCSCDYQRERFTLDEGCAEAVRHTFFKLFKDGLIYRGKRLVNWDTQLQTAVADDEVYHETVKGHFYHFKYPVKDPRPGEPEFVHLATTRPETMLGDTAVAVHPDPAAALDEAEREAHAKLAGAAEKEKAGIRALIDDIAERRKSVLPTLLKLRDMARDGRTVILPLVEREIPLICDEWAKPELGSGCVKITPAHDPNDYEVGQRHELPMVNVLTEDGKMARIIEPDGSVNANSHQYEGLRFATKARERVVADMQALDLVEKIEDRLIEIGHSDRSKTPIEPFLSDQWFVKMGDLTEEEAARVQTPFLREYIERARSEPHAQTEPRPSGSGQPSSTRPVGTRLMLGLAQLAIDAVKRGEVRFHPPRYEKTYLDWLSEKRDWCISRQLWWGHRIPVWTYKLGFVSTFQMLVGGAPGIDKNQLGKPSDADENARETAESLMRQFPGEIAVLPPNIGVHWTQQLKKDDSIDIRAGSIQGNEIHVCLAREDPIIAEQLEAKGYRQTPDVLDTWFSSALWPHSTLGWPGGHGQEEAAGAVEGGPLPHGRGSVQTGGSVQERGGAIARQPPAGAGGSQSSAARPEGRGSLSSSLPQSLLSYWYPTNVLSTAREIITLWVARMVMTGLYNVGWVPFTDVVIHPVIQDGQGRKMSKTAGNGVDPVDIIDEYGADALRFTLADLATETQDIRMPVTPKKRPDGRTINISEKFEKGRNFCNKLWQAATGFVLRNLEGYSPEPLDPAKLGLEDRWILSRMTACQQKLDQALARYEFSAAAGTVYSFMWDEFCSWYIEMSKPRLTGADRTATQQVLVFVLDRLLRMLHPFIPFVTEAIWAELRPVAPARGLRSVDAAEPALVAAAWPVMEAALRDEAVESQMSVLQEIIKGLRDIRTVVNDYRGKAKQPSMRTLPAAAIRANAARCGFITSYAAFVKLLGGCDHLEVKPDAAKPHGAMSRVSGAVQVFVPVADLIDLAEVKRQEQGKLPELQAARQRAEKQLANENFVSRADPAVVAQTRERASELSSQIRLIEQHLADLD